MGRGRNTTGTSAAATTNSTIAENSTAATAKVHAKNTRPAEKMNGKEQPPAPEESDDSSQDASVRTTRRALQIAATKTQISNATIPKQSDKTLNIRSRLRKSTQINHNTSLNLVESKTQKNIIRNTSNRSSPAELVISNDQVSIVDGSVGVEMAPVIFHSTIDAADIDVAGDDNVVNTIEICDEGDNLSMDTDTITTESSLMPDSNEATCSADDEGESSIFSEDSRIRSSSIIAVMHDESNSMQMTCDEDKQNEQNSVKESPAQQDVIPDQSPTVSAPPLEPEDRSLSSPDFFNLPKPKIVRTYANKRKLRAETLKKGPEIAEKSPQNVSTIGKSPPEKEQEKSPSTDQPECRRSQRQRVIKYDVRDLFNMKGSRNNPETKNARSSHSSQKTARDSPRSDVSSSPQTFRGFSDTDDTSSPVPFAGRRPRNLKAAFDSKDLGILAESSSRSATPVKSNSPATVNLGDVENSTTVPSVAAADTTPSQQVKVTRVPLKKEPSKPSRILPRRKTVLLNRSAGDNTDSFNDSSRATDCSENETNLTNISTSVQLKTRSKTQDKRPAKNSDDTNAMESSIVILESASETADKSKIIETSFANSSIQCDLEIKTEAANNPECTDKSESKLLSEEAVEKIVPQSESINRSDITKPDVSKQEIFSDEGIEQTCNQSLNLSAKVEESKTAEELTNLKQVSETTKTTTGTDSKMNESEKPKKSSKRNQKTVELNSTDVRSSTPVRRSAIKKVSEESKVAQTQDKREKSKTDKREKETDKLPIENASEVSKSKNDLNPSPKPEQVRSSITNIALEESVNASPTTMKEIPPKRQRSKGELKFMEEDVKRINGPEIKAPDKSSKIGAPAKTKSTKSKKVTDVTKIVSPNESTKDVEKTPTVDVSEKRVAENDLNRDDEKKAEKIREQAKLRVAADRDDDKKAEKIREHKLRVPTEESSSSPKPSKEHTILPSENVEDIEKDVAVDKFKRKADSDKPLTGSSKKIKSNAAYDEIDIFAAADLSAQSKKLKDSKRSSSTKRRTNDPKKTTDSPIPESKPVEDVCAATALASSSQLNKSETSIDKNSDGRLDRTISSGSKDANENRVNKKDSSGYSSTPKSKSSRSNRDNSSHSSSSSNKRKSETTSRLSKDDKNSIKKDFLDKSGGKGSRESNAHNTFGKPSERDIVDSQRKQCGTTIVGSESTPASNNSTERSSSTKKQSTSKNSKEDRTSSQSRSIQKSSSRSLERSSNSSRKRIINFSTTEAGTPSKEAVPKELNSVEQKTAEIGLCPSTQEITGDHCAVDNRKVDAIDNNLTMINETTTKDDQTSDRKSLLVTEKIADNSVSQQLTQNNSGQKSICEADRIEEKSSDGALSGERHTQRQQLSNLSAAENQTDNSESVSKLEILETTSQCFNNASESGRDQEKAVSSMKKRTQRSESLAKGRVKRCFSKSRWSSNGISDVCSSDSSDSKQTNTINNIESFSTEVKINPAEQPPLPPDANFSSVLNGLSTAVMNDLLQWTCNNKETLQHIKDTIDQNQRIVAPSAATSAVDAHDGIKKEDLESDKEPDIATNSACNEKTEAKNEPDEPEKFSQSSELLAVSEKEDTSTSSESNAAKDATVILTSKEDTSTSSESNAAEGSTAILTSKEMLAELMNSAFDDDDNFSELSEVTTKSEPIPKSKLSQEIKRLMKCSESALALDSFGAEQTDNSLPVCSTNIRRSHRIKTQVKSSTVGRGLVRSKSDRNQNSTNALNLEAQNAKFLKDMEERLSQFQMIKDNEYKCERIISKEAKRMTCDCFLTREEEDRGELGCGEDCLNRLLMIECPSKCTVGERCTNRRFQQNQYAPCKVFRTEKKGFGIMADKEIAGGEFIMEYVGEVLNGKQFEKRAEIYCQDKNKHFYFMALRGDCIIDATQKGSISRFINHSCDPNAETQKWTVNGELRIGFFSKRTVYAGEEITFDYQFQRYGKEAQKCYCESASCRGWIGEEPESDDEELSSSDSEDEIETKSMEVDVAVEKDKIVDSSIVASDQPVAMIDIEAIVKPLVPENESVEPIQELTPAIEKPTDKEKSDRKALKAAEKFAKIAAKMKARQERELIKQKNRLVLEDPDLEAEIVSLEESDLKNQAHTLKFSRCMVRVKHLQSKLRLLGVLRNGDVACKRLFLDYHGLRLLHGWVSENETSDVKQDLEFRRETLITLELIPIPNKTMLKDSKVFDVVQNWSVDMDPESPPPMKKTKLDQDDYEDIRLEIKNIALKLTSAWEELPEVFRIPKRERIEQMKEHEREANRRYKALSLGDEDNYNSHMRNKARFGTKKPYKWARDKHEKRKEQASKEADKINSAEANLTKLQRRQLFAAKVAKDEAEKRLAEERREFDCKCKFYGLDPRHMTPNTMPFCVNPATGEWYSKEKRKIATPPSHAHIKVPPKPQSTDPKDYKMPELDLPPMWTFAMDPRGRLYYYHVKIRIPQWEPPIKILPLTRDTPAASTESVDSIEKLESAVVGGIEPQPSTSRQALGVAADTTSESDDSDSDISCSEIIGLKKGVPLKIGKDMIEELRRSRRRKRFSRLVQERTISPRREEDRAHNQIEMRRYRENKEKIRRRKEEIKRRKAQLRREMAEMTLNTSESSTQPPSSPQPVVVDKHSLPIQDYLLSSDEEDLEKADYNNSLIEKIVHGDNIVDELDAIAKEKPLKRSLPFVNHDVKKKSRMDDRKRLESGRSSEKPSKVRKSEPGKHSSRKSKEKFRSEIAGIIVHHLTPYRRDTCQVGRITNNEDFKHLARKLTHFVLIKELKHCDMTGQTLVVTESVKNKSREFIKKYMAKYGEVYIRPANDPEFRDIPQ